jgi:hypothetical protein
VSRRREPGFYSFGARGQAFYQKGGLSGLPAELPVTIGILSKCEWRMSRKMSDIFLILADWATVSIGSLSISMIQHGEEPRRSTALS